MKMIQTLLCIWFFCSRNPEQPGQGATAFGLSGRLGHSCPGSEDTIHHLGARYLAIMMWYGWALGILLLQARGCRDRWRCWHNLAVIEVGSALHWPWRPGRAFNRWGSRVTLDSLRPLTIQYQPGQGHPAGAGAAGPGAATGPLGHGHSLA